MCTLYAIVSTDLLETHRNDPKVQRDSEEASPPSDASTGRGPRVSPAAAGIFSSTTGWTVYPENMLPAGQTVAAAGDEVQ